MSVRETLVDRPKAALAAAAAHRGVRTVAGAILAPAVVFTATRLSGVPLDAYLLELGLAAAAIGGGGVGWLSMQDDPNVVKLEVDGQLARDTPSIDEERCDVEPLAETLDDLQDAHEDDDKPAQAVIVEIDSPGGPVGPSGELHEALDEFDGPSVAVIRDVGASGGYMAAVACDRILAQRHSIVGSIGVAGVSLNYHDLLDEHGISYEGLTAGEHKDAGHPAGDTDDSELAYRQDLIDAFMDDFVARVTAGRDGLDEQRVRDLEGGVRVGEAAADVGLVDDLGDTDDAREWLTDELDVDADDPDDLTVTTRSSLRPTTGRPAASLPERVAYATGQGVASVLADRLPDPDLTLEFRYRP